MSVFTRRENNEHGQDYHFYKIFDFRTRATQVLNRFEVLSKYKTTLESHFLETTLFKHYTSLRVRSNFKYQK